MITKENTYRKAFENIKQQLKEKQAKREMLLNALYASNPRLEEINRELSFLGANIAIAAVMWWAYLTRISMPKALNNSP